MRLCPAKPRHDRVFLIHHQDFAAADNSHAVSHFLGFLDVMRGENDGDAALAHLADQPPHILAQFHINACSRLIEEQ